MSTKTEFKDLKVNKSSSKSKRLIKEAQKYRDSLKKRGVIYISRIPPFMKPNKVRTLLEEYGEITRLFLSEESENVRKQRKKNGGNGSKQFVEGWIEYSDKKLAKNVADSLNNTRIGIKKGDFYYDDLWNLKYLRGFKWEFLTEKLAHERRVREERLRASMIKSKAQNENFVELIEKTKVYNHVMDRRKRSRDDGGDEDKGNSNGRNQNKSSKKRSFNQVKLIADQHGEQAAAMNSKVLKKIFAK